VPALRAELVWGEVQARCARADIEVAPSNVAGALCASAGPSILLGLITWKQLLATVLAEVEGAGELAIASDVRQLQGLCDREDAERSCRSRPKS